MLLYRNTYCVPAKDCTRKSLFDRDCSLTPCWFSEIFNPTTQTWRTDASTAIARTYHSVAVLVPDGRVFVAGGGLCDGGCGINHLDAEMFSPNYLFNPDGSPASRPSISVSSSTVGTQLYTSLFLARSLGRFVFRLVSMTLT